MWAWGLTVDSWSLAFAAGLKFSWQGVVVEQLTAKPCT